MKVILASASPRRQELLKQIGLAFDVITDDTDEEMNPALAPHRIVEINSIKKAGNVSRIVNEPAIIIGADTVVSLDGMVLGKPLDEKDATGMLKRLCGRTHMVYTGVCIIKKDGDDIIQKAFVDTTEVFMRSFTDVEIKKYVDSGEPLDKAGAYGIQGLGAVFVEKINGDFYNVMGLPITKLYVHINELQGGVF